MSTANPIYTLLTFTILMMAAPFWLWEVVTPDRDTPKRQVESPAIVREDVGFKELVRPDVED